MYNNFIKAIILSLLIIFIIAGCDTNMSSKNLNVDRHLDSMKDDNVSVLLNKKIFFGHASVGSNIVEGIGEIKTSDSRLTGLNIQEIAASADIKAPGFYHIKNGRNGQPKSKIDYFRNFLEDGDNGNKIDVAVFKLCYVDFNRESNVEEIFNYYVENIEHLKKKFPDLKIVHVTVPLYAHAWGVKGVIKNILYSDVSNVNRNRYNVMLMNRYKNIDIVFDLAGVESLRPSGKIESFSYNGNRYMSLAKEYTDDGGHLNKNGRYVVATELLKVLSKI